jgi:hypothetical protein
MPNQVFTAANIYIMAFWVMPLRRLLGGYKRAVENLLSLSSEQKWICTKT